MHRSCLIATSLLAVVSCSGGGSGVGAADLAPCVGPDCVCESDFSCGPVAPRCDKNTGKCVTCLPFNDNCPAGRKCIESGGAWVCTASCSNDTECPRSDAGAAPSCCTNACIDTDSDTQHCGACARRCPTPASATPACRAGVCGIGACIAGFADCDRNAANGCEVDTGTDPKSCGACGKQCSAGPHQTSICNGGVCASACEAGWADCNGNVSDGCEIDTGTSVMHCGGCGIVCGAVANGTGACKAGVCGVRTCNLGFGDCNGAAGDGCEANLDADSAHCGACGQSCAMVAHGVGACMGGGCAISMCDAGFSDCDRVAVNGCETSTGNDARNCGACARSCMGAQSKQACRLGQCAIEGCDPNFADCDGNVGNGCEANVATDVAHCGGCAMECPMVANGNRVCANASCGIASCNFGFADCNKDPKDGCEADLKSVQTCGACGIVCAPPANASAGCGAGKCGIGMCNAGFADCNANAVDGCELHVLVDPKNCGGCGKLCAPAQAQAACLNGVCGILQCNAGYGDCDKNVVNGCERGLLADAANCGACNNVCPMQTPVCADGKCAANSRTVPGFNGQLGPDYSGDGWAQCVGILDRANQDDLPNQGWGNPCIDNQYVRLRLACGLNANSLHYIDVSRNVLATRLNGYPERGLISAATFNLPANDIYADGNNDPNNARSWWVEGVGCNEGSRSITINNACIWDVANCFGQNINGERYFYVYVHK